MMVHTAYGMAPYPYAMSFQGVSYAPAQQAFPVRIARLPFPGVELGVRQRLRVFVCWCGSSWPFCAGTSSAKLLA